MSGAWPPLPGEGAELAAAGGAPLPGGARVLDFRRRAVPPRRRRPSLALTLARPLVVAAVAVTLPLALGSWLLTSRRFELHAVTVRHAQEPLRAASNRVADEWVAAALAPFKGRNLLRLPLAEVRQQLAANPWIGAADLAKALPDQLIVTLSERRPVVLLRHAAGLLFADAAGRPIAPVGGTAEEAEARRHGLLVVRLPAGAPEAGSAASEAGIAGALLLADQLRRLRPAWTPLLAEIDVIDEEDYRLHVDGLPCPVLVRGSRLADNLVHFEQVLPELTRRYPALAGVDLRFSRRIVVQPAPAAVSPRLPPQAPGAGA